MQNKKINQHGFTALEIIVTLSLSALMIGFAAPQLKLMKNSFDRLNAKTYFVRDLKRAQAESITQGCRGIMVIAANNKSYTFGCDFLSYDTETDPQPDVTSFTRNLPANITVDSSGPIIFNSRGQAIDIDYILTNLDITFEDLQGGSYTEFASGTLLGTGVFSFD